MASVLTHKKVPEWGGFNWDSPRQRHRFCYIVDGGASFFQIWGNQNISGFRHTKQIEIKKSTTYLNTFKIKKQNPTDLTYTDCVHEIRRKMFSSDFAAGTMIQQIFATQSALSRSEVFRFSFRYPKEFFFSRSILHSLCAHDPWDFSSDPFFCFFLLIYFKWDPKKMFFSSDLSVFRSAQPRSDGFFNTLDPTDF